MVLRNESARDRRCRERIGQRVIGTAANVSDISQTSALLHGEENDVFADAGFLGVEKRPEIEARAKQPRWHIAANINDRVITHQITPAIFPKNPAGQSC